MGDRVSIPRSFADDIGVADCLPSIRRHYIPLFHGEFTTGNMWPGPNHTTTMRPNNGFRLFQRNFTAERAFLAAYGGTTSSATTGHQIDIMAGGTTVARVGGRLWNETTVDAYVMSTTPLNAAIVATQAIRIVGTRKLNLANNGSIALVGREALD